MSAPPPVEPSGPVAFVRIVVMICAMTSTYLLGQIASDSRATLQWVTHTRCALETAEESP